ncbi:MAG: tRNA (adenosine(37)-N6)-threonylcarbamoyltransferase complex dimerization subunit type 1 TsaB [Mariprofundaceae bacterium]
MDKPILALDAAIGPASACLITDKQTFYVESDGVKPHSQIILPLLQGLISESGLSWSDIGSFALSAGPGSFTGVRVIAATVAGINASLKQPVLSISSLAVTACQANVDDPVWVLEDARANEVFIGLYQHGKALQEDMCKSWEAVQNMSPEFFVAHAEPPISLTEWQRGSLNLSRSKALEVVVRQQLKNTDTSTLPTVALPTYLQVSQAERSATNA